MNPFVNLSKRSILLPSGCKDLIDVLRLPKPKDEAADSGESPLLIKPVRFETAGIDHVQSRVGKLVESRKDYAILRITSLDGQICILLARYDGQFTIFPVMGLAAQEEAVKRFFRERAIKLTEEGESAMPTRVLGFPLPLDTSAATKLTIDLLQSVYALDDEAGLEFTYVETLAP